MQTITLNIPRALPPIATKDCGCGSTGACSCSTHKHHDAAPGKYYTTSKISDKLEMTPEGFLICHDVAIARTGTQVYTRLEAPKIMHKDGFVIMEREESEVFRPETIASFEGKPVTIDHPDVDVTPSNWRQLAAGVVTNVRRGAGADSNVLLADLFLTDGEAIKAVRNGKREVSCGYDTEAVEIEPGRGRQTQIIGNHVALVDAGRCGSRCSIQDKETKTMTKATFKERLKAALTLGDKKVIDALTDEMPDDTADGNARLHITVGDGKIATGDSAKDAEIAALKADVKKLTDAAKARDDEEKAEKEKKEKEEKEAKDKKAKDDELVEGGEEKKEEKAKDAALLYSAVKSRAEILAPGVTLPKPKDEAMRDSAKVHDALCVVKRAALTAALTKDAGSKALTPILAGRTVDSLDCATVDAAFIAASEIVKAENNMRARAHVQDNAGSQQTFDAWTKDGIDKANAQFWNKNKATV